MLKRPLALLVLAAPLACAEKPLPLPPTTPIYFGQPVPTDVAPSSPAYFLFRAQANAPVKVAAHRDAPGPLTLKLFRVQGQKMRLLVERSAKGQDYAIAATLKEVGEYVVEAAAGDAAALTVTVSCEGAAGDCSAAGQPGEACAADRPCAEGLLCKPSQGCNGAGACVVKPRFCPLGILCRTNCGCDGKIYCNECEAERAGTFVAHVGACTGQSCGGVVGCGDGDVCQLPTGNCASASGVCRTRQQLCPEILRPVCGCDGKTYSNDCKALAAGTSVARVGACDGSTLPPNPPANQCSTAGDCKGILPQICQVCSDGKMQCAHFVCNSGRCETQVCPPSSKGCASASDCKGILPHLCQPCADGKQQCAHFVCTRGNCAIEVCPP